MKLPKKSYKNLKGKLYLIPTSISDLSESKDITLSIRNHIKEIDIFLVEKIRTARRFIKKVCKEKDINKTIFYSFGKHNSLKLEDDFLPHILSGKDVGVLSEAGLPCVADPGSEIVSFAHQFEITVVPLVGPSSIFLALMSSGLNGQNFAFVGYLPINKTERIRRIKELERLSKKTGQTQIFIETPYRNKQLLDIILKTVNLKTKLCIATEITSKQEKIYTKSVLEWKATSVNLHKKPTIFLLNAHT